MSLFFSKIIYSWLATILWKSGKLWWDFSYDLFIRKWLGLNWADVDETCKHQQKGREGSHTGRLCSVIHQHERRSTLNWRLNHNDVGTCELRIWYKNIDSKICTVVENWKGQKQLRQYNGQINVVYSYNGKLHGMKMNILQLYTTWMNSTNST